MVAADPTYPLYPIACILSAAMLLLVLLTSFIRQRWNLGVSFLCFWLALENLTNGVNAIIWADNADVKLYVYCDIVTHLKVITGVVKPMATFIILRRLYLITSLQTVELPDQMAKHKESLIEWALGLGIPVLVAGPLYTTIQGSRFQVAEGYGCTDTIDGSVLSILFLFSWSIIIPLLSLSIYYPRVARTLYQQYRDTNIFLQSQDSTARSSRPHYTRILALASLDIVLTLPIGIVSVVLIIIDSKSQGDLVFYTGWPKLHSDWEPKTSTYAELRSTGTLAVVELTFQQWIGPVLGFAVFGLFGFTKDARASYRRVIEFVGRWIGWRPSMRVRRGARSTLGTMEFGERSFDVEQGSHTPNTFDVSLGAVEKDSTVSDGDSSTGETGGDLQRRVAEGSDRVMGGTVCVPGQGISACGARATNARSGSEMDVAEKRDQPEVTSSVL